ncbi:MAG: TIGR03032 family protein [Pirellulales bacterium]
MNTPSRQDAARPSRAAFQVLASRHFPDWLASERISLAVSTYQSGKLFLIGRKLGDRLSVFERTFNRCMGLWSDGQTLWLASVFQIWRLENALRPGQLDRGYDRLYVPRIGYTTGDIDVHDVAVDAEGRVVFVSSLFSCLATVSQRCSFEPLWRPPFVGRLAAEDRCHMNGLAMVDGRPRFVTACSCTDVVDGWREHRQSGGVVIDVDSGEVVAGRLSMPHSPRWYRGKLWMLDSGTGRFGTIDLDEGRFHEVAFCPGYARGVSFVGDYAVVGLSCPRDATFTGLPLDAKLEQYGVAARCGLQVIDLNTGDVVHWLRIEGVVKELYDVVVLVDVARPKALGFKTDEIERNVWTVEEGRPIRWMARSKSPESKEGETA